MSPPWVFHHYLSQGTMSLIKTLYLWPGSDVHLIFLGHLIAIKVCPAPLGLEGGGYVFTSFSQTMKG